MLSKERQYRLVSFRTEFSRAMRKTVCVSLNRHEQMNSFLAWCLCVTPARDIQSRQSVLTFLRVINFQCPVTANCSDLMHQVIFEEFHPCKRLAPLISTLVSHGALELISL